MRQFQQLAGLLRRKAARNRRGSVSVEFALVSVFILGPLFGGGADFVLIMAAQAQLRTAVQALDYFAWTNPDEANNLTDAGFIISLINQQSDYQITLPANLSTGGANGALSFSCFTPPATASTAIGAPSPTTCSSTQTQRTLVKYQVTTSVFLPVPLPGLLRSPETLSATSTVQIQ
jgi:Flp pilus assembly protein TadG